MKPGSQKTPLLSLGYGICSSTMCVYLCLCSESTVDKISTKARGMRIKQAPHTRDTSDAQKTLWAKNKISEERYVFIISKKPPDGTRENVCKFPCEILIFVEIYLIVAHTPRMNSFCTEDMKIRVNSRTLRLKDEKGNYSWQSNPKKIKKKSGGIFSKLNFSI